MQKALASAQILCPTSVYISFLKLILIGVYFTMLCYFLLYSKMNQLYVYKYPIFKKFPSHLGHYRALSRVT